MTALLENRPPACMTHKNMPKFLTLSVASSLTLVTAYKVSHHVIRRSIVPLVGKSVQKCPMFMTVLNSSDVKKGFSNTC